MEQLKFDYRRTLSIIFGTLLLAIATNGVFIPSGLLSGGVSGISILLHLLSGVKISLMVILINIPIFIVGFFFLDKSYLIYSLLGMLMLSLWLELTQKLVIPTGNLLSIVLVGGIIHGIGTGIIFRGNGSTGGTDIISKIIQKHFSINMATTNLCLNSMILILSIYFFGIDLSVLTISAMFISSQVANFAVDGIHRKRSVFIITDIEHGEALAKAVMKQLHRGVTLIPAIGGYTAQDKFVLYSTISIREVAKLKQLILEYDPQAFMTVTETSQVIGNGRGFVHLEQELE